MGRPPRKFKFLRLPGILAYVAITETEDGKFRSRLQLRTSRRDGEGRILRREVTKTFLNRGAAEAWEKLQKAQQLRTGTDGTLTLSQTAEYREAKELARGCDLREVACFWAARNPDNSQSALSEVMESYRISVEWQALSLVTQDRHKSTLGKFQEWCGDAKFASIATIDIEAFLRSIPHPVTRNNHLRILKTLFKWAMDRDHHFIIHSPVEPIKRLRVKAKSPEFFTVEQTRRLFEAAIENDSALIPFLALGHFAGIRSYEIERMRPGDFHLADRRINIRAEVAKPKRIDKPLPRLLEGLPNTVWCWLESVGFTGKLDLKNHRPRRRLLYQLAGLPALHSAARHTFATYSYAHTQDCGRCRKWTGHRGGDTIFLDHYAGLETEARGHEYFEILPPGPLEIHRRKTKFDNRAKWPADQELIEWVQRASKVTVAQSLGVSEAAVRKRLNRIAQRA